MARRFRLISQGMRQLLHDPRVTRELERRMGPVLSTAVANAPVDSGAYRDSLHLETVQTDRTVVRLVSNVPHAMVVQAATGNMSRALDAAGGQ